MPHLVDERLQKTELADGMIFYTRAAQSALYLLTAGAIKQKILWTKSAKSEPHESFSLSHFGRRSHLEVINFIAYPFGMELATESKHPNGDMASVFRRSNVKRRAERIKRLTAIPHARTIIMTASDGTTSFERLGAESGTGPHPPASPIDCAEVGFYLAALAGLEHAAETDGKFTFTP